MLLMHRSSLQGSSLVVLWLMQCGTPVWGSQERAPVVPYPAPPWLVAETGWDAIQTQVKKLEKRHAVHIASYGEGNERRLTGKHETSSMHDFSWGVANRGCSIRVGRMVPVDK